VLSRLWACTSIQHIVLPSSAFTDQYLLLQCILHTSKWKTGSPRSKKKVPISIKCNDLELASAMGGEDNSGHFPAPEGNIHDVNGGHKMKLGSQEAEEVGERGNGRH
jgi:hypothetical protein